MSKETHTYSQTSGGGDEDPVLVENQKRPPWGAVRRDV